MPTPADSMPIRMDDMTWMDPSLEETSLLPLFLTKSALIPQPVLLKWTI
jgi:hypothetical protein